MHPLSAKYWLAALFTTLGVVYAGAQITFVKGYLVNDKGDTLQGEVKYNPKKEQDCYNKVFFKDANGTIKNYKPKKAKAYGFNGQNFVAMDFEGELKFYRVLAMGDINFYKMMYEVISMNKPVIGGEYFVSRRESPTELTAVKEGRFKKQMTDWMKDNPDFITEFEDAKEFNSDNATEVIKKYNSWKAGK